MDFAQSFYNQSSVLRINVMVVDDDPVFLEVMSRMLVKSKYRDPSVMEITVIAEKNPMEALSTLKIQRNNIDLIITDYYMPDMNGLQLKRQITQEFGNLPVIVMSSDTNKEQESLTCGAMGFIPKPIKPIDLTKIYQFALTYKRSGKSILSTEHNEDTDVSVPQQIKLPPEQANNALKTKKRKCSSKSDARSVNSTNGSCVSTDGSKKNGKRKPNGGPSDDGESLSQPPKKRKITWTDYLHDLFLQAIRHIGLDKAVPKKILAFMNVPYLTRENVASHLQKYRIFLRKVAEQGLVQILSGVGIDSMFRNAHIREPYFNYYTPSTSCTSLLGFSHGPGLPGSGLIGQSRLLSNTREPVRFNQVPYSYTNRSSTYEPHRIGSGSNLTLSIQSNLSFPNLPSQNEERRSFFEPSVMPNEIGQTSQVLGFGQLGPSPISGNNFNKSMVSSYGSLTPYQLGPSHFSYWMQPFLNNENAAYNHQPHANATTQPNLELPQLENLNICGDLGKTTELQPNLELPQLENLNICGDLGKTSELPYNISNFQFDHNKQQQGEADSTNIELPANFTTELNQILSLEDNGDWTFVNINQGHSSGETLNTFAAPETNPPIFNMNPNQNQEHDVPEFTDWSFLDPQELVDDEFMNSLFNNDVN